MEKHLVMASILFEKHGTRAKKDAPLDPTRGSGAQLFLRESSSISSKGRSSNWSTHRTSTLEYRIEKPDVARK